MNIEDKIREWSKDKGLHMVSSTVQMLKVTEEVGEVAAALARCDDENLAIEIGDVYVTLVILAQQNGTTLDMCANLAYQKIANRKGRQLCNGVFVKEGDI